MRTIIAACLAVLALLVSVRAEAVFHLWRMSQIYSNADGTVQYLVLRVNADGEHRLLDHRLSSFFGGTQRSFTFPNDLPSSATANKSMLIATEGFAALDLIEPDYVVPNGFFSAAGGVVDFAEVDQWVYRAPPTGGAEALRRDGAVVPAEPINFAGASVRLSEATPLNFQALWWGAPAGAESGWGVNITHQGDILFATWFTYDASGNGMWLVAPDLRKTANNVYSGPLYRTTGPAFDAVPFDSSRVTVTAAGSATFTFTDEGNGTFAYTVGSVSQSKAITRQVFSTPVPRCVPASVDAPVPGVAPSYQDLWWHAPAGSESGWGVNIAHQGDILFVTWFTYASDGSAQWLVMPDARRTGTGTYAGPIYRTRGPAFSSAQWSSAAVTVTQVGTGTFSFADSGNGTFAFTLDGVSRTKAITRQVYGPPTVCR